MNINTLKEQVIDTGKKLIAKGLVTRTWGNISCRIDKNLFALTPSGMDYLTLTPADIVEVKISDLSYEGNIKPSSEKGLHAAIYQLRPEVNFIIHTHQDNASVLSVLDSSFINLPKTYPLLGNKAYIAPYGLAGTKKLCKNIIKTISQSSKNFIIMKHHGVICFGKDCDETLAIALELENACDDVITNHYKKISTKSTIDRTEMRTYALNQITKRTKNEYGKADCTFFTSCRDSDGFYIFKENESPKKIIFNTLDQSDQWLRLHHDIYKANQSINYIIHADTPDIIALSQAQIHLLPYLDDFAQIIGSKVRCTDITDPEIIPILHKTPAVFIKDSGALCCGITETDAHSVLLILNKTCKTYIEAALFSQIKPISPFKSRLMRFVYLKKYGKIIYNEATR